jgi:hypothetical protein
MRGGQMKFRPPPEPTIAGQYLGGEPSVRPPSAFEVEKVQTLEERIEDAQARLEAARTMAEVQAIRSELESLWAENTCLQSR